MSLRTLILTLMLSCPSADAVAGAWPRPKGETFVSVGQQVSTGARTLIAATQDVRTWSSLYAEYGLTDRLTLGLDAGTGRGEEDRVGQALVFARLPVWSPGNHRFAADAGLGTLNSESEDRQTRYRAGLAWGWGFTAPRDGGWLGIEAAAELREPAAEVAAKADFTAGFRPSERWMWIAQIQTGYYPDSGAIARFAPSVVRRISKRAQLQLGGLAEIAGDDALGLSAALWLTF
jgi:hypothetical protein